MCLAIPGQVVAIADEEKRLAKVTVVGVSRMVNIGLLDGVTPPVTVGDWVLIHVGFAISRIDATEAAATLALLEQMGAEYRSELAEFRTSAIQ